MKPFAYFEDNDPEMPDWQWSFLSFKPLDVFTFKLYKIKQFTWKECFNFGFMFLDYSLVEFTFTVGNYDGILTFLNFSNSRGSKVEYFRSHYTPF